MLRASESTNSHLSYRSYSAFFGTELEIVLKAYKAETLLLVGGFTDIWSVLLALFGCTNSLITTQRTLHCG